MSMCYKHNKKRIKSISKFNTFLIFLWLMVSLVPVPKVTINYIPAPDTIHALPYHPFVYFPGRQVPPLLCCPP